METKKWDINKTGIQNSIKRVIEKKDITLLTKDAYRFVHNISGFIAHYDIHGFMHEYQNVADFVQQLQRSSDIKNPDYWLQPFFQKEQAEYYTAKSEIMHFIADLVKDLEVSTSIESYTVQRPVSSY